MRPERTLKELGEKSVTGKEDHPLRPDPTPPNPPVRIGTPDMGPKEQRARQEKGPTKKKKKKTIHVR